MHAQSARLAALLTELDDGILVENQARQILNVNRAFGQLFGVTDVAAMIGTDCALATEQASTLFVDPIAFIQLTDEQVARGERVEATPLRLADGRIFERDLIPITDDEGAPIGLCWRYRDVTLARRKEQLAEELRDIQGAFIANPDPMAAFESLLGTILRTSGSEYGFIGELLERPDGAPYLKAHAISKIAWDDASPRFYDEHAPKGIELDDLDNLFGAVLVSESTILSNDPANDARAGGLPEGHPPLSAFLGLPFRHAGTTIGMVGIANREAGYDSTIRELLEPVLATCGSLVASRRAKEELARSHAREERLRRSLQHSQRLESLATLAGGIAHDCNNSLAVVVASMAFIEAERTLPAHCREAIVDARQACDHAQGVLRRLLSFTRGSEELTLERARLGETARELTRLFRATAPENVTIVFEAESDPVCEVDRTQIHQLLLNLATNAMQVMADDGGTITVTVDSLDVDADSHPTLAPGPHAVISVSDEGPGIPEDIAERIFDPFFTTKATGEGTGLGLFVAQGIAEAHGGAILLESPGRGATFRVYLPVAKGSVSPERRRVLVVDDDPRVLRAIGRLVSSLGFATVEVGSGCAALDVVAGGGVAAVISDVRMPEMTGVELAERLRAVAPTLPMLLMTGGQVPDVSSMGPLVRADAKPLRLDTLTTFLAEAMGTAPLPMLH